ncbi:hypothetical protein BDA99DRAFT_490295 [Phascolomyces articulosus]|uniref:Uncharacterized protein n=1 Tax=Phascolomyces articulosus TaxID=60185 RepID=A0AAD5JXM1_9FUNG|nr:hypothetical protein BDA99DRAFT_490295 [Phascolomyces articulosus]
MSHNVDSNNNDAGHERPENSPSINDTITTNDSTVDQKTRGNEVKVIEARTAIMLLNYSRVSTKNEYNQWFLKNLFQPLTTKENDIMKILYLSRSRRPIWRQEDSSLTDVLGDPSHGPGEVFALTPRTNLMTMTYEYRVVYILDLSSSLATVGSTTPTILLSGAFESLRNSLEGLVQPFSLPLSPEQKAILRPRIRLTVMADCSQFASNINVIPMLAEHPTIRVFIQNVTVGTHNIHNIVARLYAEFLTFQKDTASFRNLMQRKRSTLEYDLDVGGGEVVIPQDVSILDATSLPPENSPLLAVSPSQQPQHQSNQQSSVSNRSSSTDNNGVKPQNGRSHNQSTKQEVWGMGKSGANLSRILHAGHFALKLLPREGRPQMILITDGSMKSNVHDNTFVRQFAEEDAICHIIQVGSIHSFIPGRNFGFVPDNEILTFLAKSTGGSFTYSDQCKPVVDVISTSTTYNSNVTSEWQDERPAVEIVPVNETNIKSPNIYHTKYLLRESTLTPRHLDLRLYDAQERGTTGGLDRITMDEQQALYNFPWDPYSSPPQDTVRLLRYREYLLPAEFSHVIASRAREGFILHSVSFDNFKKSATTTDTSLLRTFDAPDFSSVKKERIQIIMALQWQPNVVIEYRIRATWLPTIIGPLKELKTDPCFLPSSIFSRAKAPRAEIFVRTDAEFAHMLQNWDAFRRRAQMMGVVTGAPYLSDTYNAPSYVKAEKLKNYLIDIYEGDEVLKAVLGFNSKYLSGLQLAETNQQRNAFTDTFRNFWEYINGSTNRPRSRSWYDDNCIDLLLGDVSPYMSPKLTSLYNQDFVSNVEYTINEATEKLQHILRSWADFQGSDGTFVRIMNRFVNSSEMSDNDTKDFFPVSLSYPPSFYEVRVRREYGRLVSVRLLFFNMDVQARQRTISYLLHILELPDEPSSMICHRPYSRLLMRDVKHFHQDDGGVQLRNRSRAWYLPAAMWLTSEYIVRDYLRHITWTWQTDNHQNKYHKEHKMMPLHDLAFQFLCQARLDQGFRLVSPRPDGTHFYQEISLPGNDDPCAIQYFIWKDSDTGNITTELWMEPSCNHDQYEALKTWTVNPDRKTISHLVTFDQIHAVARSKSKGDIKEKSIREPESSTSNAITNQQNITMTMMLPQLFDVTTVLRSNAFVIASFASPRFYGLSLDTEKDKQINRRYDARLQQSYNQMNKPAFKNQTHQHQREEHQNDICLRPDPILSKNKKALAQLGLNTQNHALLHYFAELGLETVTDGEIIMTHHDSGTRFWSQLKQAVFANKSYYSGLQFTTDLRQLRCFVSLVDVRSFVIILFPALDAVIRGLSDNQPYTEDNRLDFIMFECVRKKPLKPIKSDSHFDRGKSNNNNSIGFTKLVIDDDCNHDNDDNILIKPIEWLVYEDDGLGDTMRPLLTKGHFHENRAPCLTDRVLRITQNIRQLYCKSFFRSFYTCLMRGLLVDTEDLKEVLSICDESIMEIDMTEFVNVMALQCQGSDDNNRHLVREIQGRFASIFQHYFELLHTKDDTESSLFYYKPPFSRTSEQGTSMDDQISLLVDLVACSQIPLLIRLESVYTNPEKGTTVKVPITSLPTAFEGQTNDKEFINFEPIMNGDIYNGDWSPLDRKSTTVSLNLVCINMRRSPDEEYIVTNPLISFPRESLINSMRSQPSCFSSLARDQQEALAETEARIRWLLIEETLHGLLKSSVITKPILQYVDCQLGHGSIFVNFPTVINIPFQFVKDLHHSRKIFMDELEKAGQYIQNYKLRRIGDYFYVSQDTVYNMRDEEALRTSTSEEDIESSEDNNSGPSTAHTPQNTSEDDRELCNGLGISTLDINTNRESSDSTEESFQDRPLYWLVLRPQERYISMFFYSKLQIRSSVLQRLRDLLAEVQERTNRLILLESLQETRSCSKFLEPNVIGPSIMVDSSDEESEEEDNIYTGSENDGSLAATDRFIPGQFACPVIYTKHFPLHWRLQPNVALKYLTADVLRLFVVRNRPNMYVIERGGSIVYCKIFEQEQGGSNPGGTGDTIMATTPTDATVSHSSQTMQPAAIDIDRSVIRSPDERKGKNDGSTSLNSSDSARELVLEVHGIDLPPWIEQEFIDLIENRLTTEITLNEIQHFFLRNPGSKPTPADVKFIIPLDKPPTGKEVLCVPSLVSDPITLLLFFRQSILADTIKPFTGLHVNDAMRIYNQKRFPQMATSEFNENQYCFYYNCTRRVPGTSSPLELAVGQGLAGICITSEIIRIEANNSGNILSDQVMEINPERVKACLEDEFRECTLPVPTTGTKTRSKLKYVNTRCRVWIELWVTGSADSSTLLHHIYDCFRQSLCDYLIEKTVSIDYGAALLHRALLFEDRGISVGRTLRKTFIDSVLYILQKAAEWKSPTVYSFDQTIQIMPWAMDDLLDYINCELCNQDPSLKMTAAWALLNQQDVATSNWELYQGQRLIHDRIRNNIRLVGISGLSEFVEKLGVEEHRRASVVSEDRSMTGGSRRSSITSHGSASNKMHKQLKSEESNKAPAEDRSRSSSTSRSMSGVVSRASRSNISRVDVAKHCFLLMRLDSKGISVYTYNWSEKTSINVFDSIFRAVARQKARHDVLMNILQQKMGVFHHSRPLKQIFEHYSSSEALQSIQHITNQYMTPHIYIASPKHRLRTSQSQQQQSQQQKNDITTSKTEITTAPAGRSMKKVDALIELQDMINYSTITTDRNDTTSISTTIVTKSTEHDEKQTYIPAVGTTAAATATPPPGSQQQSWLREANELDTTLAEFTAVEDSTRCDHDLLKRHGTPFFDAVVRRISVQNIHRKARQVYNRWSRQYIIDETNGCDKLLTRRDVKAIIRSSRLLHYCRTPLLFSRFEESWGNLDEEPSSREQTAQWYTNMMNALVLEYSKYLEGVDMHIIDLLSRDDSELDSSVFRVSSNFSIECTPVYLLRVVKGGSILCEVRFTGTYVSVTLYTLHRRYGRQAQTPDREIFRSFEETSGQFKQFIHVNSFVYDFHLRYIQKMLENNDTPASRSNSNLNHSCNSSTTSSNFGNTAIPILANLNLLNVLRQFTTINKQPASYARNRVLRGFYQIASDAVVDKHKFLDNLFGNSPRHGLTSIRMKDKSVGATVTSHDLSFTPDGGRAGNWKHTLIVAASDVEEEGLWLEYFILVVYQGRMSPTTMYKNIHPPSKTNALIRDSIDEMLLLEGYTLDDIVTNARDRLDTIVADVIVYCKYHNDWSELYSSDLVTLPGSQSARLTTLLSEFDHTDLCKLDNNMVSILSTRLDWNSAFDQLITGLHRKKSVKDIRTVNGKRHLLLYNHGRYMDYLIHLQIDTCNHIQGWMVSREDSRTSQPYREQIANLGNMLCHIIWRQTSDNFNKSSHPNSSIITATPSNASSSTAITTLSTQNSPLLS